MSTHNVHFQGEIRKISVLFGQKKVLYLELYNLYMYISGKVMIQLMMAKLHTVS